MVTDIQRDNFLTKCMKYTSAAYFVYAEQFAINDCIPPMPDDRNNWEKYLLQIYDATLSYLLDIQKSQFELEQSKLLTPYNYQVIEYYFKKLKHMLKTSSLSKEAQKPCSKPVISVLRCSFRNV